MMVRFVCAVALCFVALPTNATEEPTQESLPICMPEVTLVVAEGATRKQMCAEAPRYAWIGLYTEEDLAKIVHSRYET